MISVIIPNYNRADLLLDCLASLRAQSYRDFEIVVVDNGSTDGSAGMVERDFPDVRLFRFSENKGFSIAVNQGIRISKGELVALLNNDAEADPAWLMELHKAATQHPEAGFFASKMLFYDRREIIDTVSDGFSVAGFGYKKGWGELDAGQYDGLGYVTGACAGAGVYRRAMFEDLKQNGAYFDEDYFAFGEDLDISLRAQALGYKCLAVPAARVYHRVRATAGNFSVMSIYLGNRNTMMTVFKNFPSASIARHSLSLFSYWLLAVLVDSIKTGKFTVLKAYMEVFRKRQGIKKKRMAVQSMRRISDKDFEALLDRNWFTIWLKTGINSARVRRLMSSNIKRNLS